MISSEPKKVTTISDTVPWTVQKIHNMAWLKHDSANSTDPKPRMEKKDTIQRTLANQNEKNEQNPSKQKNKKSRSKSKKWSTNVSQNIETKDKNNGKSESERQNNGRAGKTETLVSTQFSLTSGLGESAWTSGSNAAQSLFPDVKEVVNEVVDDINDYNRAVDESLKSYKEREICLTEEFLENEVEVPAATSENEYIWGEVQRNLPIPETEDFNEISFAKNGTVLKNIINLTIPSGKLDLSCNRISSGEEQNSYCKENVVDGPLVPVVAAAYVDKYGRIDGYSEKRLFMGKGSRRKEQLYLQQLQSQQLKDISTFNPVMARSSYVSSFLQDPLVQSKEDMYVPDLEAFFEDTTDPPSEATNIIEKVDPFPEVSAKSAQCLNNASVDLSNFSTDSKMPDTSEKLPDLSQEYNAVPTVATIQSNIAEEFISNDYVASSEATSVSEKLISVQPINNITSESEGLPKFSQIASQSIENVSTITNLQGESRDKFCHNVDSQSRQSTKIPEQTNLPYQDSAHFGRPILPAVNPYNRQQRYSTSGQPANRSSYGDDNYRDRNSNKPVHRNYGYNYNREPRSDQDNHRDPRNNRYNSKSHRDTEHDELTAARYIHNPYKFIAGQNRNNQKESKPYQNNSKYDVDRNRNVYKQEYNSNVDKESTLIQSSQKFEAEFNRDSNERSKCDQGSTKFDGEHYREFNKDQNQIVEQNLCKISGELGKNEYNNNNNNNKEIVQQNDNILHVPCQEIDVLVDVKNELMPNQLIQANTLVEKSQQNYKKSVIQTENKEFNPIAQIIDATKYPEISTFNSRYTLSDQHQNFPKEIIPMPAASFSSAPSTSQLTNPIFAPQLPRDTDINDVACSREELQYRSSQNFAAASYSECLVTQPCERCGFSAPFEVKYARLRLHDPNLYKLLLPKHQRMMLLPTTNPGNIEHCYGTPINCNCNSSLPRNPREIMDKNYTNETGEDGSAQYQEYQQQQLHLPINPRVSLPVDMSSDPGFLSMQNYINVGNDTRFKHMPSVDQSSTTMQQYGDELHGLSSADYETIFMDAQRQIHQQLLAQHYNNASVVCPTQSQTQQFQLLKASCGHFTQPPPSLPSRQYVTDTIVRSDKFQSNSDPCHEVEHQRPLPSRAVHVNHPKLMTENNQIYVPASRRVYDSAPKTRQGRGRARELASND